ncbi:MAG: hypothetical protein ACLQL2_10860 [Methylovirgula sp.]
MQGLMRSAIGLFLLLAVTCAGATASLAAPAYELTVVTPGGSVTPVIYRLNVASGEVSYTYGVNFSSTKDPQPVPQGAYRLYAATGTDGKGSYWLYRLETQSGRLWVLGAGIWSEIAPAK